MDWKAVPSLDQTRPDSSLGPLFTQPVVPDPGLPRAHCCNIPVVSSLLSSSGPWGSKLPKPAMEVSRSVVSNSLIPWTVAPQASLSMEFSRQEYWSGLPFPSPGDLPDPGIKPGSLALQADS